MDVANGSITGTPSVCSITITYTITASNCAGSASTTISITVNPDPLSIITAEYFFDSDPGVGKGIPVASFTAADSVHIIIPSIPTTGLIPGYHNLFIRCKNNSGSWSMYDGKQLFIQPLTTASSPISAAEYFFDSDPGIGNGIPVSSFAAADSVHIIIPSILTTSLIPGYHNLFIRCKNNSGSWSMYDGKQLFIQPATTVSSPISAAEYFFDSDPGVGNGVPIPSFTAADSVHITVPSISTTGLTGGTHNLFLRAKNNSGIWSIYVGKQIFIDVGGGILGNPTSINVYLKILIEGFYIGGGQMQAVLYNSDPVTYAPDVCDSITVELHNANSPYDVAYSVTATIDIFGNGIFIFPGSTLGNSYYIAIRHRNAMETWSKDPLLFNSSSVSFDLTSQ